MRLVVAGQPLSTEDPKWWLETRRSRPPVVVVHSSRGNGRAQA